MTIVACCMRWRKARVVSRALPLSTPTWMSWQRPRKLARKLTQLDLFKKNLLGFVLLYEFLSQH
ncbi:hypothetical protein [Pseudomonas sp.]|uniref:hypothetical protein n=1 Tax=Pseudomonas sp. TaxID=306 RepID=UPI0031B64E8D